ncbi:phosphoribosylamine--glycine ligase [Phenylobacterium sp. Root77]|uniref:phosphoribosylamine--glycine ligase n=1 Tax=unclassified Phenylobacterium TaxID=2640670 RepID=UPI0006F9B710|nr:MULTISPECIES: phosphoribosylamine--glycine ligase [unclassified Phenylobacterium]KQW73191.1 phosphoribosylamine--glycine ligase [Phenylobacterium sp. Root1277]KQW92411.1 phosphoribosylamine--glycine ligase [Phenylobacterium sp. Root1290]KRC40640.1 phosphoribosylamine--glycine ligase [Phenylobacterium sp. Root77]
MNILLVGSGGREHALAWKIAASPLVKRLVMAPGNPGMASLGELRALKATDVPALVALAREIAADLVVIGPEVSVEAGLADALNAAQIPCFGPVAAAGRLESSKAFTKAFTDRHGLPTAGYKVCDTAQAGKAALDGFQPPYVIKADGLAAGKGVVIAQDRAEAEAAIDDALGGRFGTAGARVVIEEFLEGEIGSLFALCDGKDSIVFGAAQDHKRAYDGEVGPNTGGMGTYSPAPVFTPELIEQTRLRLAEPAFAGIASEGAPYKGVLFVELMATRDGPKLVEFNVRFGDPECQVLMLRLESDLVPYLLACANGTLAQMPAPVWRDEAAICVVLAADGYPESPVTGSIIRGAEQDFGPDVVVFHAGTSRDADGTLRASGGRVLNVCARGATLQEARDKAYAAVARIDWPGGFHRTDIGWRALSAR